MNNQPDQRQESPAAEETPHTPSRPLYVRVLALIAAVAVLALSVAYAWSIATGGIFWK